MRTFMYTITVPVGMHARHAGLLVRETGRFQSDITVSKGNRSANGKAILALMGLGVRQGDLIKVTIEGKDEDIAMRELKSFIWSNF